METKKSKKPKASGDSAKKATSRPSLNTTSLTARPSTKEKAKPSPQPLQEPQKTRSPIKDSPVDANAKGTTSPTSESRKSQSSWNSSGEVSAPYNCSSQLIDVLGQYARAPQADIQEVVIAVLGAESVGKSTFLQLALDLKKAPSTPFASKKASLEGLISVIRLVEIDVEDVEVEAESLIWPESVGDQPIPAIDGVLLMYNVLEPGSTAPLPPLLNSLRKDGIPTIVVASHCDHAPKAWRVEYEKIEKLCLRFKDIECFQTSINVSETHKRCVSIILRNVMLERHGKQPEVTVEQSHLSDPCKPKRNQLSRVTVGPIGRSHERTSASVDEIYRHGRNMSETLTSATKSGHWNHGGLLQTSTSEPKLEDDNLIEESEPDSSEDESKSESEVERRDQFEARSQSVSSEPGTDQRPSTSDQRLATHKVGHERSKSDNASDLGAFKQEINRSKPNEGSGEGAKEGGVTFCSLVDRLLTQHMSKADSNFAVTFLCLYRKIAAPSELLAAVIQRFEDVSAMEAPALVRLTTQLRYLAIIRDWVADYPGDFAHTLTRRMITNFVQALANNQVFAVAHKEIIQHLDVVCEDDDTEWACSDKSRSRASTMESFLTRSSAQSTASTVTADSSTEDIPDQTTVDKDLVRNKARVSSASSTTSSAERSASQSTSSTQISLQNLESAQRQAQLLNPTPRIILDKIRWHQLMDIPDEQIARELTRIDWVLYSSIRPRDLVRHISLSSDQKDNCKSLEHVNRMINQFNHVAFWVAHWILLRDKPKHRAKVLEKFMGVAWKLRYMNNYNSLGAVVAGINGTSVHRLTQTRELIDPDVQKQFMRLEILMGTQKGHFAYRLAWQNTSTPRIPFLPLHRRDLIYAEEANRSFIPHPDGDLVNWKKFEVMGQVIIEIRKSQQLPYSLIKRNEEVQRMLLDGIFSKEDDELYERSIQIEKPGAGEIPRKKFSIFQR